MVNNAVYDKSLENVRNSIDFKLVKDKKQFLKFSALPQMKSFSIFNKHLVGVCISKIKYTLNRPIYVGYSVVDISKRIMYNFHYNLAMQKYGNKLRLCMTNTDSLLYNIETEDIYSDVIIDLHLFDTSDYHIFFIANKTKKC